VIIIIEEPVSYIILTVIVIFLIVLFIKKAMAEIEENKKD